MGLFLLFSSMVRAEPAAIWAPVGASSWAATWGAGGSVVAWRADNVGLALDVSGRGAALGASVGWRHFHENKVGFDLFGAGGLAVPLVEPGLALTLGLAARFGYRGAYLDGGVGLAAPVAVGLIGGGSGLALRVPLQVEPAVGGHVGPLWLALSGVMGPVWVSGSIPGINVGGRVSLGWEVGGGQ